MSGIAASLAAQDKTSDARGTLTVGVIVASVMAASVIYDVEAWTLKRQTIVHFMVMALTVFPALCLSGWFPTQTAGDIMVIGGYFLVAGLVSWVLAYCVFGILVPRIQKRGSRSAALNSDSGHPKRAVDCQKVLGRVGCGNLVSCGV